MQLNQNIREKYPIATKIAEDNLIYIEKNPNISQKNNQNLIVSNLKRIII